MRKEERHVPVLDGVRGLAITLVLVYHFVGEVPFSQALAGRVTWAVKNAGLPGGVKRRTLLESDERVATWRAEEIQYPPFGRCRVRGGGARSGGMARRSMASRVLEALKRPEYMYHPTQIVRRVVYAIRPGMPGYATVQLPWRLAIRVQPGETVGSSIRRMGIHELPACECISRLLDPGEVAVDVGANIGQMTSLMAMKAGPHGRVLAFEPHPAIFDELERNTRLWGQCSHAAPICIQKQALSDREGVAQLMVPDEFEANHGISSLESDGASALRVRGIKVAVSTLCAALAAERQVGLLKIDVEGHELAVLTGGEALLAAGRIRDILFEEHRPLPTLVTEFLAGQGYTVFRLASEFRGPSLTPALSSAALGITRDAPNFLATRDPKRALARMSPRGWMVYSYRWNREAKEQ